MAIFPRSGPAGSDLGPPQLLPLPIGTSVGPIGDHVVAVATPDAATFFVEQDDTWMQAGSVPIGWPYQVVDMTDDWMVVRRQLGEDQARNDAQALSIAEKIQNLETESAARKADRDTLDAALKQGRANIETFDAAIETARASVTANDSADLEDL